MFHKTKTMIPARKVMSSAFWRKASRSKNMHVPRRDRTNRNRVYYTSIRESPGSCRECSDYRTFHLLGVIVQLTSGDGCALLLDTRNLLAAGLHRFGIVQHIQLKLEGAAFARFQHNQPAAFARFVLTFGDTVTRLHAAD